MEISDGHHLNQVINLSVANSGAIWYDTPSVGTEYEDQRTTEVVFNLNIVKLLDPIPTLQKIQEIEK